MPQESANTLLRVANEATRARVSFFFWSALIYGSHRPRFIYCAACLHQLFHLGMLVIRLVAPRLSNATQILSATLRSTSHASAASNVTKKAVTATERTVSIVVTSCLLINEPSMTCRSDLLPLVELHNVFLGRYEERETIDHG